MRNSYQTLFLSVQPNISVLGEVCRAQQASCNVVQQPLSNHLDDNMLTQNLV